MTAARRERIAFAALAVAAILCWALVRTYPNYDSYYHLVWGRELLGGALPSYDAYAAPTPHPLWVVVSALVGLLGEPGDRALVLLCVLAHVALVWAVYRLGTAVWDRRAGAAGAFLAGSAFAILLYTAKAYLDVPYLALVFWAAALEAERPHRGRAVFVLLALAGLLRPEAWLLSGAYLLFRWAGEDRSPRTALRLAPWAAIGPVLWMASDLIVTGDPLWSLHATSTLAEDLGRDTGLRSALREGAVFLAGTAREPVAAAAVIGAVLTWRRRDHRAGAVPAALVLAGVGAFLVTSAAGLSVLPRYLTVPAVVVCLLAGYLVTRTRALFALAVVAGLVFVLVRADVLGRLTTELRFVRTTRDDLRALVTDPRVTAARRCGPVTLPNYRLLPDVRWYLDASRDQVGARSDRDPGRGVALVYADGKLLRRYGFAAGTPARTNVPAAGFVLLARNSRFAAYVRCPR